VGNQAVIFDLYGTLVDNFNKQEYEHNLRKMAKIMRISEEGLIQHWTRIYEQRVLGFYRSPEECIEIICKYLEATPTTSQIEEASRIRRNFVYQSLTPRPDTIYTINRLKSLGLKIGLLSDCSTEIPELWPRTEFYNLFDTTTFSCNEAAKKPMPKIYILTADRLQVAVENCTFVGDGGSLELTGAARIGMQPIRIRTAQELNGAAIQVDPDPWVGTTISKLSELIPLFDQKKPAWASRFSFCFE